MALNYIHVRYGAWSDAKYGTDGPGDGVYGSFIRAPLDCWLSAAVPVRSYRVYPTQDTFFIVMESVAAVLTGLKNAKPMGFHALAYDLCPRCLGKMGRAQCAAWDVIGGKNYEPQYDWQAEEAKRQHEAYDEDTVRREEESARRKQAEEDARQKRATDEAKRHREREERDEFFRQANARRAQDARERAERHNAREWEKVRRDREQKPFEDEFGSDAFRRFWKDVFGEEPRVEYDGPTQSGRANQTYEYWRDVGEQAREHARKKARENKQQQQHTYGRTVDPEEPKQQSSDRQREEFHKKKEERRRQHEQGRTRPAPQMTHRRAAEILGVSTYATSEEIQAAWRNLARQHHPDVGGTHERMSEINAARDFMVK